MTARHLLPLLLLAGSAALNAATVRIEPPDPTSKEPVLLVVTEHDTCPPAPAVTRNGFTIGIALGTGICLSPPQDIVHRLNLGVLPAGTYTVNVTDGQNVPAGTATFVVLDANDGVRVVPSIGTRGQRVAVFAELPCPGHTVCPIPEVFFGGVQVFDVDREGDHWTLRVPPHAPGAVEVRVTNGQATKSSFAFRYIDAGAPPHELLFEKVLIPIVFNGPGAHGSNWVTDFAVRSDAPFDVAPWRPTLTGANLPSNSPITFSGGGRPQGAILGIPRVAADQVHFNVLVRDTTRQAQDLGTQIPVLRESELKPGPKELLNVPVDPRYRLTLRLYTLGAAPAFAKVTMYTMTLSGGLLHERIVPLTSAEPCQPNAPCASDHPAYAMVGDLPTSFGGISRVGIQIDSLDAAVPVWGFMTVTNNDTQHVTVISPE